MRYKVNYSGMEEWRNRWRMLRNEFSKKMNTHNIRENTNMGDLRFLRPFIHKSKSSKCDERRDLDSFRDVENLLRNNCSDTERDTILMHTSTKSFHSHQNQFNTKFLVNLHKLCPFICINLTDRFRYFQTNSGGDQQEDSEVIIIADSDND